MQIARGIVKFFNEERYFGFIETEDQGDFFFHGNELMAPPLPKRGDVVLFEIDQDKQGRPKAVRINHLDQGEI